LRQAVEKSKKLVNAVGICTINLLYAIMLGKAYDGGRASPVDLYRVM